MTEFLVLENKKVEIARHHKEINQKPCLVFLHEGLGCVKMWKDFPRAVSFATGCPAFVFSRFGYGKSSPSPLPWKINFMHTEALRTLPQILSAAGIDKYILIGHSDGGSISIIFSGSNRSKSGLMGLVTLAAHVFCENLSVDSIAKAKVEYETGQLKKGLEKYHHRNTENAFRGWNDVWLNPKFMKWNIEKYLPRIKVPMLALQGADDQYGTKKQLNSIQHNAANVTSVLIENCRHAPHFEQPEITLRYLKRFIRSLC